MVPVRRPGSARPRLTADVDITVRLRTAQESDSISGFCRDMEEKGFRLRISDPEFLARTRVLPFLHTPTGLPLDVVLAGRGLEDAFIERAILVDIEGLPVPVVSPEDLIVMKILAGRTKDLEDVRTVLIQRRGKLDIRYIRSVLGTLEQALGQSDLLPLLQSEVDRLSA
jgi:predicted nucleotidyltransferase